MYKVPSPLEVFARSAKFGYYKDDYNNDDNNKHNNTSNNKY